MVVNKGWKICDLTCSGIPKPVSLTEIATLFLAGHLQLSLVCRLGALLATPKPADDSSKYRGRDPARATKSLPSHSSLFKARVKPPLAMPLDYPSMDASGM
jgi:hypothetical protein